MSHLNALLRLKSRSGSAVVNHPDSRTQRSAAILWSHEPPQPLRALPSCPPTPFMSHPLPSSFVLPTLLVRHPPLRIHPFPTSPFFPSHSIPLLLPTPTLTPQPNKLCPPHITSLTVFSQICVLPESHLPRPNRPCP